MCGIAAILGDLPSDRVEMSLRAMLDAQFHRGPDDGGSVVISTGQAVLGLRPQRHRSIASRIPALGARVFRSTSRNVCICYVGRTTLTSGYSPGSSRD